MPFDTVTSKASLKPQAFNAHVSDSELEDFKTLMKVSRIGPKTYENQIADVKDFTSFGITRQWLEDAKTHWVESYDWRKTEARINSYPNYTVDIEEGSSSFTIHFVALFSKKSDAVPLLLMHGWPGSFLEFLGVLDEFQKKYDENTLPFHLIVPSLPGYGYSSGPPLDKDFNTEGMARVMDKLMVGLGFGDGYITQGGDIGSFVSRILAATSPACKAAHCTSSSRLLVKSLRSLTSANSEYVFRSYSKPGTSNEHEPARPESSHARRQLQHARERLRSRAWHSAIDYRSRPLLQSDCTTCMVRRLLILPTYWTCKVLANSHSRIGEKFQQWSDTTPPLDDILDSVMLYWFTDSFPRSIFPYRQIFGSKPTAFHNDPTYYINKPLGYSWHPQELLPTPTSLVAEVRFRDYSLTKIHEEPSNARAGRPVI